MAVKDAKLRTFITADNDRDGLVGHVYDVTYGVAKTTDTLVILDDSIVRGTTLKSILRILDRLKFKRIIVVSSAPQKNAIVMELIWQSWVTLLRLKQNILA